MVENLDLALLVGGLALSQVDSATPLGTTLRVTGNVTSTVATEVVIPVAKTTSNFYVRIPSIPSRPIPSHPVPFRLIPSHPIPSHPIPSHPSARGRTSAGDCGAGQSASRMEGPSHPIPSHPIPSHPSRMEGSCALRRSRWSPAVQVQNELGYKARAVLELGLEKAVEALNPKRRVADGLAAQYERLASEAAQLRAERDAVPFWQLQERWGLDDRVRAPTVTYRYIPLPTVTGGWTTGCARRVTAA